MKDFIRFMIIYLPDVQKFITNIGKQTAFGEQHELTMHTDVLDVQVLVTLSHGSNNEHRMPGAQ